MNADSRSTPPENRSFSKQLNVTLSNVKLDVRKEADYIVSRARDRDARCVVVGPLLFFSTQTGDAWMLDLEDNYALCLARDGDRQPVRIFDIDGRSAVEWDRTFTIDGDDFTTTESNSGRKVTISGYPMKAILASVQLHKEAKG